jgi:hypothetical protein
MSKKNIFPKSNSLKKFEKSLSKDRKQKSEDLIKQKLDKKKLDYDTMTLILEVFKKSKFQWLSEHFDVFDSKPDEFKNMKLPKNNRECVMLGLRLGTIRSKIIYNLQNRQVTEKQRQNVDDLIWKFIVYSWKEARMIYDFTTNEIDDIKKNPKN